jgi:hypothetical protein
MSFDDNFALSKPKAKNESGKYNRCTYLLSFVKISSIVSTLDLG